MPLRAGLFTILCAACAGATPSAPPARVPPPAVPAAATATATTAAEADPTPPEFRLPDGVRPIRYAVDLGIVPTADTFTGEVAIDVELAEATDLVWLQARDLTILEASVEARGVRRPAQAVREADWLGLRWRGALGPGPARLHVRYQGQLRAEAYEGLFRNQEAGAWYVFSHLEPTGARRVFPCFDEPRFKTPFEVVLRVPREDHAVANAPVIDETEEPGGRKRVRFAATRPLPTYLFAVAVGPFDVVDAGVAGRSATPVRILTPRGRAAGAAQAARRTGAILTALEDYFDLPYPYTKLDQIAIPAWPGGAMENPGLITYGMRLLLDDRAVPGPAWERALVQVVAHELAHQWFGNLVTLAWWDDIWLNEGFASWLGDKVVAALHPEWEIDAAPLMGRASAMAVDELTSTRRVRQPIASAHDIAVAFDSITYAKGQAVLSMFEAWLGPTAFQRAIRRYVRAHADGIATTAELVAAIDAETGADTGAALSSFIDQPGVPLVQVVLRCEGGRARAEISQRRLLPVGSTGSPDARWHIPLCVRYGRGRAVERTCALLAEATGAIELSGAGGCPTWIMGNEGGRGYYRVGYGTDLLEGLRRHGMAQLGTAERVAVADDLLGLVGTGDLALAAALAWLPRLARDRSGPVVERAVRLSWWLAGRAVPPELRGRRDRYLERAFGVRARALGWEPIAGEPDDQRLLRPLLLGRLIDDGSDRRLVAEAVRRADRWIATRSGLDRELVMPALIAAADRGERGRFERLKAALEGESDRRAASQLAYALGSFRDPDLLGAAFELVLAPERDPLRVLPILWGALGREDTRALALAWLDQHLDALLARVAPELQPQLFWMGGSACDPATRAEVVRIFGPRAAAVTGAPNELAQALESIDLCMAARPARRAQVRAFLRSL